MRFIVWFFNFALLAIHVFLINLEKAVEDVECEMVKINKGLSDPVSGASSFNTVLLLERCLGILDKIAHTDPQGEFMFNISVWVT